MLVEALEVEKVEGPMVESTVEAVTDKAAEEVDEVVEKSKKPSSNRLSRLYLIKPPKESRNLLSNRLSRLWRPEKFFVRGRSKTLDCL